MRRSATTSAVTGYENYSNRSNYSGAPFELGVAPFDASRRDLSFRDLYDCNRTLNATVLAQKHPNSPQKRLKRQICAVLRVLKSAQFSPQLARIAMVTACAQARDVGGWQLPYELK